MKELVEHMAKALVTNPDAAMVTQRISEEGDVELLLQVAPKDMGKVIGKQGRIAKAMRVILKATANKEGKNATLEIE